MQFIAVLRLEPAQKQFTHHWHSIVLVGCIIVSCMFANKGCQKVHCGLATFHSVEIVKDASTKIVNAQLMLNFGHGYDLVVRLFT
jgi:hypothetical protein